LRAKRSKEQGHSETKYGRHFTTCFWNAWTNFNETCQSDSLPGSHDTDDILKVTVSTVKVADSFAGPLAEAYRSMVICCRPSSFIILWWDKVDAECVQLLLCFTFHVNMCTGRWQVPFPKKLVLML